MWLYLNISVFLCVIIVTWFFISKIILFSYKNHLLDEPDIRKIHEISVPRLGGITFLPAIILSVFLVFSLFILSGVKINFQDFIINIKSIILSGCAIFILYLTGITDDIIRIKYQTKLIAQIIFGILLFAGGFIFDNFHGFLGLYEVPFILQLILTILFTLLITNSINLIDGIDGLASAISSLAFIVYGIYFYYLGIYIYAFICFASLGSQIPFFYYNVFGKANEKNKIFMGDSGALTIGGLLCVFSMRINMLSDTYSFINPSIIAYSPLLIPCLDVVRVFFRRVIKRRNPFMPDTSHIHHKLLGAGLPPHLVTLVIISLGFGFFLLSFWLSNYLNFTYIFLIDIILWFLFNFIISRIISHRDFSWNKKIYQ